jgi:hypothetical protein
MEDIPATIADLNVGKHLARQRHLKTLDMALAAYHQDYGVYPAHHDSDGLDTPSRAARKDWLQHLAPAYLAGFHHDPLIADNPYEQYLYQSNGRDYKLIVHDPEDCEFTRLRHPEMIDPKRGCRAYGYWTEGAKGW